MSRPVRWAVLTVAAVLLSAGAAAADEQIRYAPPPAWVKVAPLKAPSADPEADGAIRIVHLDTQVRYGPEGDDLFIDRAIQVLNRQGLEAVGMVGQAWHPGTQSLTFNTVEIIRDGEVIDALKTGEPFVALRQETNLAQAILNGQLTATKQLEDVRVGDIVRVATTTRYHDPMVDGHSQYATALVPGMPAVGYMRQRHLWSADKSMKWRAGEGFLKPTLSRTADGFELLAEGRDVKPPVLPAGAPGRFRHLVTLTLSDFSSWKEVSALFADDYAAAATLKADSPLKAEAAKIAEAHSGPVDRASAALTLVQERVRYLALTMGQGGFKPADADQTWSRKFGDCKGKSALLVALLQALGIEAEVVAVVASDDDDGQDEILPSLAFDHVIVRATIAGKTYWLDPTRQGDGAIERLVMPGYRWVLPLRAGGATLQEIRQVTPSEPETETVVEADYSGGLDLEAPLKVRVNYRGDAAMFQYAMLTSASRTDAEAHLKERWSSDNWLIDKTAFGRAEDGTVWIEATGKQRRMWQRRGDRREFEAPYSSVSTDFDEREAGSLVPKAPYAVPFPSWDRFVSRTRLPAEGAGFDIVGPDLDIKAAGQWVVRRTRREGAVVIVEEDDRTTAREISFAEAATGPDRLAAAGATKDVIIRAPVNFRLSAEAVDTLVAERPSRETYLMRAAASYNARDYDRALQDLDHVLAEDPTDVTALQRRSSLRMVLKDTDGALKDLETALAKDPENGALHKSRAHIYLSLDKLDLALASADAAVAGAPNDAGALLLRSQVRGRLGDREGRLADFAKSASLSPENVLMQQAYIYMLYEAPGQTHARNAALEKLHADRIAAAPADPQRYLDRADLRLRMRNIPGAFEDIGRAIAMEPTPRAYLARAEAYRGQRDNTKALADLDAAVKLDSGPRALVARARYNSVEATPARWLADARAAAAKAPEDLGALEEIARAALVLGDNTRAREAADAIARLKPNDLEALRLRALVKEQSGDLPGAIADMRQAVSGPAGATVAGRSGRLRLAALLSDAGQHAEAVAVLGELHKAFPIDAEILDRLCRVKAGRNVEAASAAADCEAALRIEPSDADHYDGLGLAHLRVGAFDRAIAAYDEALSIRPGQSTSLFGRALAREGAGDLAGARADAALAARYDRGGLKEMAAYGLAPRDPGLVQALAAPPARDIEKSLPKSAVVVLPDWAEMPSPPYPERAVAVSREGKVEIACVVMSGGQLSNCHVEREWPQDYEFGATLVRATAHARMKPLTVHGEPVDGADINFASPFLLD